MFFIGAGSHTERVADLFGHARWPKLHAGFRSEGALLLLYCSALNLARLAARPDGVLILAPEGVAVAAGNESHRAHRISLRADTWR